MTIMCLNLVLDVINLLKVSVLFMPLIVNWLSHFQFLTCMVLYMFRFRLAVLYIINIYYRKMIFCIV